MPDQSFDGEDVENQDLEWALDEEIEDHAAYQPALPPRRSQRERQAAKSRKTAGQKRTKSKSQSKRSKKHASDSKSAVGHRRTLIAAVLCGLIVLVAGGAWLMFGVGGGPSDVPIESSTPEGYAKVIHASAPSARFIQPIPPPYTVPPFTIEPVDATPQRVEPLPPIYSLELPADVNTLVHRKANSGYPLAPRGPLTEVDRSSIVTQKPVPPETWQQLPTAELQPAPMQRRYMGELAANVWQNSEGKSEVAMLQLVSLGSQALKPGRSIPKQWKVVWHRIRFEDAEVLDSLEIYPYSQRQPRLDQKLEQLRAVALSEDGTRLAVTDAAAYAVCVDVFDQTGEAAVSFVPYSDRTPVEWVGWNRTGLLLTLGGGSITGWKFDELSPVFEVDGSYRPPLCWANDRSWLVASAGYYADVLDATTGQCLGRIGLDTPAHIQSLAVSPGNESIAVSYGNGKGVDFSVCDILVVDTQTGSGQHWQRSAQQNAGRVISVHAANRDHLALWCSHPHRGQIVSMKDGTTFSTFSGFRRSDGRLFREVESNKFVSELIEDVELPSEDPNAPRRRVVRVEAKIGYPNHNMTSARTIAKGLARQGHQLGDNDYVLRVTGKPTAGRMLGIKDIGSIHLPAIKVEWMMYDPDGKIVWRNRTTEQFRGNASEHTIKVGGNSVITKFRMKPGYREEMIASIVKTIPVPPIPLSVYETASAETSP